MGYMRHHAIIVTSYDTDKLAEARRVAGYIFGSRVSDIIPSPVNEYASFFIPPDGSKEGWEESDKGDTKRDAFIKYLDAQRDVEMGSALRWVEIQYGDDEYETCIIRESDAKTRDWLDAHEEVP